jgi:2'-5' RNA ligase
LAGFLDRLRLDIDPGCKPHAHVTLLPPRPLHCSESQAIDFISEASRWSAPIEIELGTVEVFPGSNVVFLSIVRGERDLYALHDKLDTGCVCHECQYPFHPHITIAQDMDRQDAERVSDLVRERWAMYDGPRDFTIDRLAFVRNESPWVWRDLADIDLADPVPASR